MPSRSTEAFTPATVFLGHAPGRVGTVTLDEDEFTRDADGHVHVQPGLVLASAGGYGASDLWGPYESGASDGRQGCTDNVLICMDYVTLDDGVNEIDKEVAVLLEGTVKGSKVMLQDGSAASDLLKNALRSKICNVTFDIE
jgi:hypothetical protein